MTERLFGTDGIRGVALQPPLDRHTVTRLGAALAGHLLARGGTARILMAGDTRESTGTLAEWLGGAFIAAGGTVTWGGVLPTPAVSRLLRAGGGYDAGVIISASHNPAEDNGIKLVDAGGAKWSVGAESQLEERLAAGGGGVAGAALPAVEGTLSRRYAELLQGTLPPRPLAGVRVVIDAANGAASAVAGPLFAALGAEPTVLHDRPDGTNINAECGALFPGRLAAEVRLRGADAGVALDGDADRAILVTHTGRVLDGDDALLVWARALSREGALPGGTVVATVMSNLGLEAALRRQGMRLVRCAVGDREVWDTMQREGAALGGEQSGHVICAHHSVTGDGLLTAAHLLAITRRAGAPLEALADLERFPQLLVNVPVTRRLPLDEVPGFAAAVRAEEEGLSGGGRVLVRFSGTEPVLRIMVEAGEETEARAVIDRLSALAHRHLG